MRSKPEIFQEYAQKCRQLAAAAPDVALKRLFSNLAEQWTDLAATVLALHADADVFSSGDWRQQRERMPNEPDDGYEAPSGPTG
jgi:hypothetical protein